jgi:hypothetical protein
MAGRYNNKYKGRGKEIGWKEVGIVQPELGNPSDLRSSGELNAGGF